MLVIPAIDLRRGKCVRLVQGRFDEETVFADDPVAVAQRWADEGAQRLHVVNLDGALGEDSPNRAVIERLVGAVPLPVQLGGGLRSPADIAAALACGVDRVILGTIAVRQPEVVGAAVAAHGAERVAVAVDARDRRVAVQGWLETTTVPDVEFAQAMARLGVIRCIYTDIARDGTGAGPNVAATAEVARLSGLRVIASGGVGSVAHVRALLPLEPLGVEAVVVGRALYTGQVALADLLAAAAERDRGGSN